MDERVVAERRLAHPLVGKLRIDVLAVHPAEFTRWRGYLVPCLAHAAGAELFGLENLDQFAAVEVDIETGQVTVDELVMAVDCGVPINPVTASGQVEGGMVQALGYGHCEEMVYDEDGRMVNPAFGPYKIYRSDEVPRLEAILVQTMEASGPFGAKAIAEIPKDGVAPALRNAIIDAAGVNSIVGRRAGLIGRRTGDKMILYVTANVYLGKEVIDERFGDTIEADVTRVRSR